MAVDSLVEELPTGAQTNIGDGYPVAVHSREFCPWRNCPLAAHRVRREPFNAAVGLELERIRRMTA